MRNPASYSMTSHGYERWTSRIKDNQDSLYVHRLLAVAKFGFDQVCDMDVHHKNGIKWDNRHSNIDLKSREDHMGEHLVKAGKITPENCGDVGQRLSSGESVSDIAEDYGVSTRTIYKHGNKNCKC